MQKNNITNIGVLLNGICACLMLFAPAMCGAQQYTITTIAGGKDVASNSGLATDKEMYPSGIAVNSAGNFYVADGLNVVYKVTSSGNISVFAGTLNQGGYSGDGNLATGAQLYTPEGLALDPAGNLYIADSLNSRIRKVDTSGIITTIAGGALPA